MHLMRAKIYSIDHMNTIVSTVCSVESNSEFSTDYYFLSQFFIVYFIRHYIQVDLASNIAVMLWFFLLIKMSRARLDG